MEKLIKRTSIYDGKILKVSKDEVSIDDTNVSYREVVHHNGGACIGLKHHDKFIMVKQYRYALGKYMLEFPAGKIELGEDPDQTILREAIEETGFSSKDVIKLGQIIPTCGYSNEIIHLYYGLVDEYKGQDLDVDERINTQEFTMKQIEQMILDGTIDDAKTIAIVCQLKLKGLA